jgi:hypothetical protein
MSLKNFMNGVNKVRLYQVLAFTWFGRISTMLRLCCVEVHHHPTCDWSLVPRPLVPPPSVALATRGIAILALTCIPPLLVRYCVFLQHYCVSWHHHHWIYALLLVSSATPHSCFLFSTTPLSCLWPRLMVWLNFIFLCCFKKNCRFVDLALQLILLRRQSIPARACHLRHPTFFFEATAMSTIEFYLWCHFCNTCCCTNLLLPQSVQARITKTLFPNFGFSTNCSRYWEVLGFLFPFFKLFYFSSLVLYILLIFSW